jgi:Domain of unknown function (DUF4808)
MATDTCICLSTGGNSTALGPARGAGVPLVRAEEAMIVCLVLLLWVGAIALFFNRWGKIRMLEPYQPKFQPSHRASCPLLEMPQVAVSASPPCPLTSNQRLQASKYNMNEAQMGGCPRGHLPYPTRPRQNSVFAPSPCMLQQFAPAPRKAKSAVDLQDLFLEQDEYAMPMLLRPCRGRRASSLLPPLLPTVPDDFDQPDVPLTIEPPTPTPESTPCQHHVVLQPLCPSPSRPSPALLRVTHV